MGPIPPGFTWEMQTLFPSPFLGLPPAAEKTGTPPVPLRVPWAATLGDGPRDSAGRRQDEEVGQSRGALRGPSLRSRVGAGPRQPRPPASTGTVGDAWTPSGAGMCWSGLGTTFISFGDLRIFPQPAFHPVLTLMHPTRTQEPVVRPEITKSSLAFSPLGRRDNWWPQRHCVLPPGLFLCPRRFKGQPLFQKQQ